MTTMTLVGKATPAHVGDGRPQTARPGTAVDPFVVRAAGPRDQSYAREWLPDAVGGTPAATFSVAADAITGEVAGVAALRVFADGVGRFLVFVKPDFRRRGCGTVLLDGVREAARAAGATRVLTGRSTEAAVTNDGTRAVVAFMQARGLAVAQEIVRNRAALTSTVSAIEPIYLRYERAPAQRSHARIVTADQVNPRALAAFVVREVGGLPEDVTARLQGRGRAFDPATSHAALVGDAVVGTVLTLRRGPGLFIESLAVDAAHRGGWVNLALMHYVLRAAAPLGIQTIEFEHDVRVPDMAKLARRIGATVVGRRQCWGCPLPATAGTPVRAGSV